MNNWSPSRYEKVIANKDYNLLAFLFYDLHNMGYNIAKNQSRFVGARDRLGPS
jgi:hypothetical protein